MNREETGQRVAPLSPRTKRLSRDVVANQLLFTAGHSLTSGGFLVFFAADLGASTRTTTWVLTLPELVGLFAMLTPALLQGVKNKKGLFLGCSVLSRLALFLVPAALFLPGSALQFPLLISAMILMGIFQAVAYTAYLSWLAELAPQQSWGRFFARRNMAKAAVLILVPFGGAMLRDWFRNGLQEEQWQLAGYLITFGIGNLLQLASLVPLLKWKVETVAEIVNPSRYEPVCSGVDRVGRVEGVEAIETIEQTGRLRSRSLIFILLFSWWLSLFQGLTQTAFFLHSYRNLHLAMTQYYALAGCMYLLQLLSSWWAGKYADRNGYRDLLIASTWIVSFSLLFWAGSMDGRWIWLWGAYLLWGGFGAINLSLQNLLLKIAPQQNNTLPIAMRRYGSGLIAGLTGLAGGYWLEQMLATNGNVQFLWGEVNPFLFLFLLSFAGRFLAPVWLLGVDETRATPDKSPTKNGC